jgi:thymidylate synthase (FAD)
MKNTKLVWVTPNAEDLIVYIARVSNPENQSNTETSSRLIKYLIDNKHWSPFEMASICFEINTSLAISSQIIRHRSFSFQQFSMRYQNANALPHQNPVELRYKAKTNRQSSLSVKDVKDINPEYHNYLERRFSHAVEEAFTVYNELVEAGIANESARGVLPTSTGTRLYMSGTLRSWIHYIQIRCDHHTQKEHREIAEEIKTQLEILFPNVFEALKINE